MTRFVYIIFSILLLLCACTDNYSEETPSSGELTFISLDGVIADRNDDFTKSLSTATTEQQGGIAVEISRFDETAQLITKANPTSFFVRYMFFNSYQSNIYTSEVQTVTPSNNTFSLKLEIPKDTNGELFVFMTYKESELPKAAQIKTKTDLNNYWSAYTLLSKDDIIPIVGSINVAKGDSRLSMNLKHIGSKLNLRYSIKNQSDFKLDSICIGNVPGRNYFVKPVSQNSNTTDIKRHSFKNTNLQDDLTFYIPENLQENKINVTKPSDKNKFNAPSKATYIELIGKQNSTGNPLRVRIYPGANNTSDFNLMRNGYYRVNLDIYYLDPNDDRITIGTENPVLIFDVVNAPPIYSFVSYLYIYYNHIFHDCKYTINQSRIIVTSKIENIGKTIALIDINQKRYFCSLLIKPGTNYYTLDWNNNGTGSGSEDDPYLVASKENLDDVRNHLNSSFLQVENIELGATWGSFNSIGGTTTPFRGIYDGGNKTINSYMQNSGDKLGIFQYIEDAVLKNINLTGVNIQCNNYRYINIGGLVAKGNRSSIINCSVNGKIGVRIDNNNVGGIIGEGIDCYIESSIFEGNLSSNSQNTGQIIGKSTNCIIN